MRRRNVVIVLVLLLVVLGGYYLYTNNNKASAANTNVQTATITRGNLIATVNSAGPVTADSAPAGRAATKAHRTPNSNRLPGT
jgi:hypothetical protein